MKIMKADVSFRKNLGDHSYSQIPAGSLEKMDNIAKRFFENGASNECGYFIRLKNYVFEKKYIKEFSEKIAAFGYSFDDDLVVDLYSCKIMTFNAFQNKYEHFSELNFNSTLLETFIIDDMLVSVFSKIVRMKAEVLLSEETFQKTKMLPVDTIFFTHKNTMTFLCEYNDKEPASDGFHYYLMNGSLELHISKATYVGNENFIGKRFYWEFTNKVREFFGNIILDGHMTNLLTQKDFKKLKYHDEPFYCPDDEIDNLNALVTNYELPNDWFHEGDIKIYKRVLFEKHGDVVALRLLRKFSNNEAYEPFRIFIKNGEVISVSQTFKYGFVKTARVIHKGLKEFEIKKCDIPDDIDDFKYVLAEYEDTEEIDIREFIQAVQNPMIEKLRKIGFEKLVERAIDLTKTKSCSFDTIMTSMFGKLGPKTTPQAYLGINKHQIEVLKGMRKYTNIYSLENMPEYHIHIRAIKFILGRNNISYLDNNSFDKLLELLESSSSCFMYNYQSVKKDNDWCLNGTIQCLKYLYEYLDNIKQAIDTTERLTIPYTTANFALRVRDTLRIAKVLKDNGRFSGNPFNIPVDNQEYGLTFVSTIHDNILEIYNEFRQGPEYENAIQIQFDNLYKKWSKFEFVDEESGYCILAPKTSDDICNEGMKLHHCVKSYIESVKEGRTNIFFIRRIDDKETPFYTAEVTNSNIVRQVHGLCNCDVKSTPGLSEFITKWMKEKHLKDGGMDRVLAAKN